MTEAQIKHMVDRFLGWKLPENFNPDAGISFDPIYNRMTDRPARHEPSGTNLFDATQADAMVRYMLDGMPTEAAESSLSRIRGERGLTTGEIATVAALIEAAYSDSPFAPASANDAEWHEERDKLIADGEALLDRLSNTGSEAVES